MKKTLNILAATVAMLLMAACSDSGVSTDEVPEQKTAIVYFSAQNSLSRYVMRDLNEISKGAELLKKGETVVVYLDRDEGTQLYVFDCDHTTLTPALTFEENLDSSDPQTLAKVLSWAKTNYPATSYGLTLWSHADGWLPPLNTDYQSAASRRWLRSFGIDDGDDAFATDRGTSISVEALAQVLRSSGMKFRYVFFDACLMQCIEVDYALRNVADYIIGAPISTTADGAYYTHQLTGGLFADDPSDIARTYYEDVRARVSSSYSLGIVVSAVKTAGLDSLATLTRQLMAAYPQSGYADMSGVQAYAEYTARTFYRPDCFDAAEAVAKMVPEAEAALWREQLERCVVYKGGTPTFYANGSSGDGFFRLSEGYSGVSMFVPQQKYSDNAAQCPYGDLNSAWRETEWAKYIEH